VEVEKLTRMFQQIDVNRDGEISFDELRKGLEKEGMKYAEIKALMDNLDADHNGKVNYTEFLAGFSGEGLFT
jgi:calcium-dependent protein kinase